jgi:hypothetical protein
MFVRSEFQHEFLSILFILKINEELNQRIQTISNQSIISDQIETLKTEVNRLKPITNSDDNIDGRFE